MQDRNLRILILPRIGGKDRIEQEGCRKRFLDCGLSATFEMQQFLLDSIRKVQKDRMSPVVETITTALIDDAHKIVLGGSWVRKNLIHFARDQRRLIVSAIDAQRKTLGNLFHESSK